MKTVITSLLCLLTLLSADAKDMHQYLSQTQDLVRQGKHEEALERFIWFHNHALKHEPSMYGVRLSFALSYWKQLGEVHPPALEAMERIRSEKTERLKKGNGDAALFHDVLALNQTLGEEDKTIRLFKDIDRHYPEQAKGFWRAAQDTLLDAKEYELARKYIGDPVREFTQVREMYQLNLRHYDDPRIGGEHFKRYNENRLVEQSLKLIDLALALEETEAAQAIQKQALSLLNDPRLRNALKNPNR